MHFLKWTSLIFICYYFDFSHCVAKSVYVGFQLDGKVSSDTILHYKGTIPQLQIFSICFRWQVLQYRDVSPILSYATDRFDNEMNIVLETKKVQFQCCNDTINIKISFEVKLDEKNSMCLAVNLPNQHMTSVINGIIREYNNLSKEALYVPEGGYLLFGQDQDLINGGFNKRQSFRGYIIDFSLQKGALSINDMLKFTNCAQDVQMKSEDLIFDFSKIQENFELLNVTVIHKEFDPNFCHSNTSFISFIPGLRTFQSSVKFCHSMGGEVVAPKNAVENANLFELLSTYESKCENTYTDITWLGIYYNSEKSTFEHYITGDELTYVNTRTNRTKSLGDKCVTYFGSAKDSSAWYGVWMIKSCKAYETCVACFFSEPKKLHLRGLCKKSDLDRYYYLTVENGTEYFRGEKYSFIRFVSENDELGYWKIFRKDIPSTYAIMKQDFKHHFPIGKNTWEIIGDSCRQENDDLILTFCENNQFTCSDGSCIPLDKRCNLELDCFDHSDEADCLPLILPESYSNQIPAPKPNIYEPLTIWFYFDIHSVKDFDLKGFNFLTEISLTLEWRDSRLDFKNLKDIEDLNVIDVEGDLLPWLPQYQFEGDQNSSGEIKTVDYILNIKRMSPPLPDNDEYTITDEKYFGSENDLVLSHKFTLKTSCQFDLADFPFDTQICKLFIILSFSGNGTSVLEPIGTGVKFSGKRKLLDYMIQDPRLYKVNYRTSKVNAIEIRFRGLSSYYITNTYCPTLILLAIGYLPFYFPVNDFSDRIIVAVTSLLVEAAFFSQLGQTMPHTSYLKMIDIWCIFCIVIIFLIALLLTIINFLNERNHKEVAPTDEIKNCERRKNYQIVSAQNLNFFGRIFLPIIILLFLISYFIATY